MIKLEKIIAIALIIFTFCIPFTTGYASTISTDDIEYAMKSLNIMSGYADGSMHLDDKLTRAQFAKIIINASSYRNSVPSKSRTSPFRDVPYTCWAAPYVSVAASNGLIKGYPDSSFMPDKNVTLEEAVTIILTVMGYKSEDFGSSWPYGQLSTANGIGLLKGCSAQAGTEITRKDAMQIIYNMLNGNTKSGTSYIESMGYKMLKDVILIATSEEDSSIPYGNISTSSGTYKLSNLYTGSNAGKKGNAIMNSNDEIICFIPAVQEVTTYTAYAALENDIIVASSGGYTESLGLGESTTVYFKGEKLSVQNSVSKISAGDIVNVSRINGSIDYVVISGNKMEGPVMANNSNWYSAFNIDENVKVLRNGNSASVKDINSNDVLYYSKSLNILWAYNKKITGVYESASPNRDQPSSVKVSGTDYMLETTGAFNKMYSKGIFNIGDTVTLLLGKDGKVADVVSPTETRINVTGYLTEYGKKEAANASGYKYNTQYVKIATLDGDTLEYEASRDYSSMLNSVVSIKFSNGLAVLSSERGGGLYGTFDWGNRKLGSASVSKDIKIMDVGTVDSELSAEYAITYPQRIDNVSLDSSDILYYNKNENGGIDSLILKNVTGDSLKYGIVTSASVTENGMNISSSYKCDINGSEMILSSSNSAYTNVKAGQPAAFDTDKNSIISIKPLTEVSSHIVNVNEIKAETSKGEEYLLSGNVAVYDNTYYNGYKIIPLSSIINNEDYNISAYYDKTESNGGRIRVIVVTQK